MNQCVCVSQCLQCVRVCTINPDLSLYLKGLTGPACLLQKAAMPPVSAEVSDWAVGGTFSMPH